MIRSFTKTWLAAATLLVIITGSKAGAQMRITEFMYQGANGEFVEFTNIGNTAINMNGWSYSDDARTEGLVNLSPFGTVNPGESVILTETAASTFRTAWNLCNNVKVIGGYPAGNLGRADEINLYKDTILIDRLTYNDQGTGTVKGPRTNNTSAYTAVGNLGANIASGWVLSTIGDRDSSITAGLDKGSPGRARVNAITTAYVPCPPAGTLTLTLNNAATTDYLDGGAATGGTNISFSGVISDPGDPGATLGIALDIKDNNVAVPAASYTLTATSSNTSAVANSNITLTKSDGAATIKVLPSAAGYTTITLKLTKGANTQTFLIDYAASAAAANPSQTIFHSGYSDGSAALALDSNYMVIADDEKNVLNVYARNHSGVPAKSFDYSNIAYLSLTDQSAGVPREIDVEATAKSLSAAMPNRSYWMGSLSNQSSSGSSFNDRPNRDRIFAVDITGTGPSAAFNYIGSYKGLRNALIDWGTANSLGLAASAVAGKDPKLVDGFNIEGMAFAPDSAIMYIGFRAPLQPVTNRVNALIAPIRNFETWFGTGTTVTPVIDAPILLNLNGRGIRDMARLTTNLYVILAGDYDDAGAIATAVYQWNGNAADAPLLLPGFDVNGLNPEGVLPLYSNGMMSYTRLQIISDNGASVLYGDNTASKDLATNGFKKFRSDFVISAAPLPIIFEDFQATAGEGGKVTLSWRAAINPRMDHFVVERSTDGKHFEPVAMQAASYESMQYSYTDHICCAPAFFYRLREVMNDGSAYYSNIKMIRLDHTDEASLLIGYNNDNSQLSIASTSAGNKTLTVHDLSGKALLQKEFTEAQKTFSLTDLPAGLFMVQVRDGNNVKSVKIVR